MTRAELTRNLSSRTISEAKTLLAKAALESVVLRYNRAASDALQALFLSVECAPDLARVAAMRAMDYIARHVKASAEATRIDQYIQIIRTQVEPSFGGNAEMTVQANHTLAALFFEKGYRGTQRGDLLQSALLYRSAAKDRMSTRVQSLDRHRRRADALGEAGIRETRESW